MTPVAALSEFLSGCRVISPPSTASRPADEPKACSGLRACVVGGGGMSSFGGTRASSLARFAANCCSLSVTRLSILPDVALPADMIDDAAEPASSGEDVSGVRASGMSCHLQVGDTTRGGNREAGDRGAQRIVLLDREIHQLSIEL